MDDGQPRRMPRTSRGGVRRLMDELRSKGAQPTEPAPGEPVGVPRSAARVYTSIDGSSGEARVALQLGGEDIVMPWRDAEQFGLSLIRAAADARQATAIVGVYRAGNMSVHAAAAFIGTVKAFEEPAVQATPVDAAHPAAPRPITADELATLDERRAAAEEGEGHGER